MRTAGFSFMRFAPCHFHLLSLFSGGRALSSFREAVLYASESSVKFPFSFSKTNSKSLLEDLTRPAGPLTGLWLANCLLQIRHLDEVVQL